MRDYKFRGKRVDNGCQDDIYQAIRGYNETEFKFGSGIAFSMKKFYRNRNLNAQHQGFIKLGVLHSYEDDLPLKNKIIRWKKHVREFVVSRGFSFPEILYIKNKDSEGAPYVTIYGRNNPELLGEK